MNGQKINPVLVEVTRGDLIESRHRGAVAVVDDRGEVVASWGNINNLVYPRSAAKPFQAMVAVESGAFEAFGLGDSELALHCASHNGEAGHVDQVKAWLEKIGLNEQNLECGSHLPFWISRNSAYSGSFSGSCPLHNNCSGKHTGFLTTARHMGVPVMGYTNPDHPVQQATAKLVAEMVGLDVEDMTVSMDACQAPVFGLPLKNFAYGLARLATQKGLPDNRANAARQVSRAMRAHPWNVAGTGRPETLLMQDAGFKGIAKCGAEGVYAMTLPEQGLGVAVKVDDGGDRAAHVIALAVLNFLGVIDGTHKSIFPYLVQTPIQNWYGKDIGVIRSVNNAFKK